MSRRPLFLAVLMAGGLAWGSTQSLGKIAVSAGHGPLGLVFWQFAISSTLMGAVAALRGRRLVLTRPALVFGLVIAVIGTLLRSTTFYLSVERLPAGIMSVLISAVPLLAFPIALALRQVRVSTFASQSSYIVRVAGLVWTMAMLGESFPPTIWAALVLMFAGLALVSPRERQPLFERS